MRKIAAMAETNYIGVIPHNNAGPLRTPSSLHASLTIANVVLMEAPFVNRDATGTDIVEPFSIVESGYALPLDGPGLWIQFTKRPPSARHSNPERCRS